MKQEKKQAVILDKEDNMMIVSIRHELVKEIRKERMINVATLGSIICALICLLILLIYLLLDTTDTTHVTPVIPQPIIIEDTIEISADASSVTQRGTEKTEDDILAELCMGEAGNQPMVGKIAVVTTVLNRSRMFDKSIEEIVTQKGQYRGYPYKGIITNDCYKAVQLARELDGVLFPQDMIYFRADHFHKFADDYTQIGDHYFSTKKEDAK